MRLSRMIPALVAACLGILATTGSAQDPTSPEDEQFFETEIRPLFVQHCAECHGEKKQEAGLRLDARDAAMRGGDAGPVVAVGDPNSSRLIQVVRYDQEVQMPPDGKLSDDAIAALTNWIRRGAPWPEEKPVVGDDHSATLISQVAREHWAFKRVEPQPVPDVQNKAWLQSPVDNFILAKLQERGLVPSQAVDRPTLIRRVTYDLTGLPPTLDEVNAFVADSAPDAYARLVDRLLASPRYGERWGRHWLDIARYADTKGYTGVADGDLERREYPFAYSYRDWVIKAMNDDLPYDQFLIQQIAADKLPLGEDKSALAALGFFRVGRVFLENKRDQIDDKIDVLMRGTQALTVVCARCHDHKFDPIPTADYYSLVGIFESTNEPDDAEGKRMLLADDEHPHNAQILKRGNPSTPGGEVPRQFLSILAGPERKPFSEGSGRGELAQAIASRENPLTARVMVNRVWAHHFGAGLVPTPSDFGVRTEAPAHLALLDYLADRFMNEGWSLKQLHRILLLSSTYQQASQNRPECVPIDSENRLLWRAGRRRLDFEQMRDSMLAVSGELDLTMSGPAVDIAKDPFPTRRTVYARVDRQNLPDIFRTFDFANPDSHSAGRFQTTVPQQGLFLLNHPFVLERARGLIKRLDAENLPEPRSRAVRLYQLIFARQPVDEEISAATTFVAATIPSHGANAPEFGPWQQLAQALLLTNEFTFVD